MISGWNTTAYLESMLSNVPTIIFWEPGYFEIRNDAKEVFKKLKKGGLLHFATDHIMYAYNTKNMFEKFTGQKILFNSNRRKRPITNYERRGLRRKNFVFDLIIKK